jgi:hypothetical protein
MMGGFAIGVLVLALAGALASWIVGAVAFARCIAASGQENRRSSRWLAVAAWPFALKRLQGAAAAQAAIANKAIVAFLVCMTLAAATISLSTNFNRVVK